MCNHCNKCIKIKEVKGLHLHKQPKVRVWDQLNIQGTQLVDHNEELITSLSSRWSPSGVMVEVLR